MKKTGSQIGQWVTKLGRTLDVVQFAVAGDHPRRLEIFSSFLKFHSRHVLSKLNGRPVRSFRLLDTEMHFTDPGAFRFLLGELFINGGYRRRQGAPATILDCGSNIGMSILYFKSLWPDCRITGVEASPETFALLQRNVSTMRDVLVINAAVYDRHGTMSFYPSSPNSLTGSSNALRSGGEAIAVKSIPMSDLVNEPIDLLKIDIEGSEGSAFSELEASGKMHLIREMLIEYRYNLPGEPKSLTQFLDRLTRCGFEYEIAAELPQEFGESHDMFLWARRSSHPLTNGSNSHQQ